MLSVKDTSTRLHAILEKLKMAFGKFLVGLGPFWYYFERGEGYHIHTIVYVWAFGRKWDVLTIKDVAIFKQQKVKYGTSKF